MADKEPEQVPLFEAGEWWEEHWKGMPEYVSKDCSPFKTVFVHFESRADMEAFSRLVGQIITLDTKFIWYPEMEYEKLSNKRYIDCESDES